MPRFRVDLELRRIETVYVEIEDRGPETELWARNKAEDEYDTRGHDYDEVVAVSSRLVEEQTACAPSS